MNRTMKRLLLVAILSIFLVPLLLLGNVVHIKWRVHVLGGADHAKLLLACREAITKRVTYRNDNAQWGFVYRDDVVILPPMPNNLPQAIQALKPNNVIISKDSTLINLSLPLSRILLIGYRSGARQCGTFKYIDGLWICTGPVNADTNNN